MNILHLISSGGYYGAENVMVSLAETLQSPDCRSTIAVFDHSHARNDELIHEAERRNVPVVQIPCRGRWDRQAVQEIRETLKSLSIDVLHSHGYKTDIYGYLAARKLGIPLIATCHNWTHDSRAVRLYEFLDSLVLRASDAVVVVSESVAATLRSAGVPKSKIHVIYNGVDPSFFSPAKAKQSAAQAKGGKLVVGTVGRLIPLKGLTYLLRAARDVLVEVADAEFIIVGSGPERERLERLARELGIQSSVTFVGYCTDMPAVYASMDVFVLPSLEEAMPMVILEALAANKPVIATGVGAVPRMIASEKTGLLVQPKDVQGLKVAILRLLRDASLRSQLANAGQAEVRRCHSHQAMAQSYLRLYQQVARRTEGTCPRTQDLGGTKNEKDATQVGHTTDLAEGVRSKCEMVRTLVWRSNGAQHSTGIDER